jgi:hypothetical protein
MALATSRHRAPATESLVPKPGGSGSGAQALADHRPAQPATAPEAATLGAQVTAAKILQEREAREAADRSKEALIQGALTRAEPAVDELVAREKAALAQAVLRRAQPAISALVEREKAALVTKALEKAQPELLALEEREKAAAVMAALRAPPKVGGPAPPSPPGQRNSEPERESAGAWEKAALARGEVPRVEHFALRQTRQGMTRSVAADSSRQQLVQVSAMQRLAAAPAVRGVSDFAVRKAATRAAAAAARDEIRAELGGTPGPLVEELRAIASSAAAQAAERAVQGVADQVGRRADEAVRGDLDYRLQQVDSDVKAASGRAIQTAVGQAVQSLQARLRSAVAGMERQKERRVDARAGAELAREWPEWGGGARGTQGAIVGWPVGARRTLQTLKNCLRVTTRCRLAPTVTTEALARTTMTRERAGSRGVTAAVR